MSINWHASTEKKREPLKEYASGRFIAEIKKDKIGPRYSVVDSQEEF
jgi:hypothetical protein